MTTSHGFPSLKNVVFTGFKHCRKKSITLLNGMSFSYAHTSILTVMFFIFSIIINFSLSHPTDFSRKPHPSTPSHVSRETFNYMTSNFNSSSLPKA
ncbi:hypothetical protein HMPREF3214_00131 [Alloscardovia omnicolens]|nr:hypothetical protein HMPREF3214_00131 [Alloscardovia omnicolens]